ncbi:MAG: caspase family protein [Proteobacteria bacterium]|nr:caspase family protein [Pseudomonadota bacterium]MBU4259470.1 caspase family protein [Pseudomonadota bacterium]MBU4289147.1 caspase family protein [Pseudomonadota bacterium]
MENYTFTGQTANSLEGTYTFPLGQMISKNIFNILSPAFNKAILVKSKPYPQGIDVIVIPKVEKFQFGYDSAGAFKGKALAKISIKLAVYDMKGMLVWEGIISSPKMEKIYSMSANDFWEATGSVAAESVVAVLQEAAKVITSSREIHTFVSTKGVSETIALKPPGKELPIVKSDVDELPAIKAKPNKNAYAIVIGIEQYRQKLPKADYAVADAKTMTEYLTNVMGYPEENVVTLTNEHAAKSDFEKYFEKWLPNNVEKDGSVFIYYSGHGTPNVKTGDAYLVPYDGDPSFIEQTGYPLKKLYESLNKLQAKEIIVALDSCFSGAGGKSVIAKGARPLVMNIEQDIKLSKNMIVMSASSGDQISSTYEEKGHGLFTYFFLKGIKEGKYELGTLYNYLKPQVERIARKTYNNEQTPGLIAPKGLLNLRLYDR